MQAVAAVTITYTQTTYTVTQSRVVTAPVTTTTENIYRIVTQTVTPTPQTACRDGGGGRQVTVTVARGGGGAVTQTNIVYSTTRVSGTVWVVATTTSTISNAASATACWRAGGWFGA